MVKPKIENETKADKFKRIASSRTQNILDAFRRLGNCSNTTIYEYTDEDINKIFSTIEKEVKRVKLLFNTKKRISFSLR